MYLNNCIWSMCIFCVRFDCHRGCMDFKWICLVGWHSWNSQSLCKRLSQNDSLGCMDIKWDVLQLRYCSQVASLYKYFKISVSVEIKTNTWYSDCIVGFCPRHLFLYLHWMCLKLDHDFITTYVRNLSHSHLYHLSLLWNSIFIL